MNSWVGFCLYVAAGVFLKDQKSDNPSPQSLVNIEFLLAAMSAIGQKHSITRHFSVQLELDVESVGLRGLKPNSGNNEIPNIPINGLLAERNGVPMTVVNLQSYATSTVPTSEMGCGASQFTLRNSSGRDFTAAPGIVPGRSGSTSAANSPNNQPVSMDSHGKINLNRQVFNSNTSNTNAALKDSHQDSSASPSYGTPSSGSSNTMQVPYRQAEPKNTAKPVGTFMDTAGQVKTVDMFPWNDPNPFTTPSEWTPPQQIYDDFEGVNAFLRNSGWDSNENVTNASGNS